MYAALIIATGKNTRRDNFQPQRIVGSIPAIKRIVMVFQRAGVEHIVVVCGGDEGQTEKLAANMNVVFLHQNGNIEMIDGVKTGLSYLQDKCEYAMITHTDAPLFSVETIRSLMISEGQACIPSFSGKNGHPIRLNASFFPDIISYTGGGGLSDAMKAANIKPLFIKVEDEGVLTDALDDADYTRLSVRDNLQEIYPAIKIRLVRERPFYGPGAHQLLQLTDETGSLREACRLMGMSYNKGRGVVTMMERQSGFQIIESQQGGKTGGHSIVTGEGKDLMRKYAAFYSEAKLCLHALFDKHFAK